MKVQRNEYVFVFTAVLFVALSLLIPFTLNAAVAPLAAAATKGQAESSANAPSEGDTARVNALVAGLSDEQVRQLLLAELRKSSSQKSGAAAAQPPAPGIFFGNLLNSLSSLSNVSEKGAKQLLASLPEILPDLYRVFVTLCPFGTPRGAMLNILWVLVYISLGLLIELLFRRLVVRRIFSAATGNHGSAAMSGIDRFMAGMVRELPSLLGILIFFSSSYIIYFTFIWTDSPYVRLFFLALLVSITLIRMLTVASRLLFSPAQESFRILPLNNRLAQASHTGLVSSFSYIIFVLMFAVLGQKLGAQDNTIKHFFLLFVTLLLAATAVCVLLFRTQVKEQILSAAKVYGEEASWGRRQFASIWHLPAIAYLLILWVMTFHSLADPYQKQRGAFILSFFVVPIWMICDKLLRWLVGYTMATLKIYQEYQEPDSLITEEDLEQRLRGKQTFFRVMTFARACLVFTLFIWVAGLWNFKIPVFSNLSAILFDTLVILTVAIMFWQVISSWIERKIKEATPDEPEKKEDEEEDWGVAATRGRAYTLLPMLRKFIGTILVTMVTMTILSSMGVDIGPLLAGAGVVGLAVGFGAQKIVADMFSGFFYLLDDAFRVGEYIEAGGLTGTVENISLRNVMLRHHRGMLQIVPHSDLGAVTNYMRGGIIVKFNLDFPYDADIDQIRKIIKKVGQSMLEDEAFKKDFIRPVKSQGVREIANSVMSIRVKFTAKPGAHFLIRREAYKRITEALRAKGIDYAHKKVIVDIPLQTEPTGEQILKAAGAATRALIDEEEQKAAAEAAAAAGKK